LQEREKEIEADARDRQKEKDELEELRNKIYSEEHSDPNAEFERVCATKIGILSTGKCVRAHVLVLYYLRWS